MIIFDFVTDIRNTVQDPIVLPVGIHILAAVEARGMYQSRRGILCMPVCPILYTVRDPQVHIVLLVVHILAVVLMPVEARGMYQSRRQVRVRGIQVCIMMCPLAILYTVRHPQVHILVVLPVEARGMYPGQSRRQIQVRGIQVHIMMCPVAMVYTVTVRDPQVHIVLPVEARVMYHRQSRCQIRDMHPGQSAPIIRRRIFQGMHNWQSRTRPTSRVTRRMRLMIIRHRQWHHWQPRMRFKFIIHQSLARRIRRLTRIHQPTIHQPQATIHLNLQ